MNNKKGFTIIEVVLSFTFAVIILAAMFVIVINYQNRTDKEKIISNLLTYKNGVLEIVYQDVIGNNIDSMETCGSKCIKINTKENTYKLEGKVDNDGNSYIEYKNNNYVLPDSKNNLSKFNDFEYHFDSDNKIFKIEIPIIHAELDDQENDENTIEIVVSGKEFVKPVNKLDNPTIVLPVDNLIYNDKFYELVVVNKLKGKVYYSLDKVLTNNNYSDGSTNIPNKKDAGTYTIYYYVEGTDDYNSKGGTITVKIEQRKVSYKADDASKGYDGTVLMKKTASLVEGTLVNGHTASFEITGSIINAGTESNILKNVFIVDKNGVDVTKNYNITKINGTLKIVLVCDWVNAETTTPTSCTSISKSDNPTAGDEYVECVGPYSTGEWRFKLGDVKCNDGLVVKGITSGYDYASLDVAGLYCQSSYQNLYQACNTHGGAIGGANCSVSQLRYYVKNTYIYQCSTNEDTITLSDKTFSYTGSPIEINDAISESKTDITYTYYGSLDCSGAPLGEAPIDVGKYSVKATSAGNADNINSQGEKVYISSSTCAVIEITKGNPTINIEVNSREYDGKEIELFPITNIPNGDSVITDYTYKYYNGSACQGEVLEKAPINAGVYSVIVSNKENDNLQSVDSACTKIEILTKKISISEYSVDYTGEKSFERVYETGINDETLKIIYNSFSSNVGTYEYSEVASEGKYVLDLKDGNGLVSNYNVISAGDLIINGSDFECPSIVGYNGVYDGSEHSIEVSGDNLEKLLFSIDNTNWVTKLPTRIDVGVTKVYIKSVDNNVLCDTKEIVIEKRDITYKADSFSKEYDGTALTINTATLISGSLVNDHIATFDITGSQISVGSSTNTLNSVVIKDGSGNDVSSNYNIILQNGELTVTDKTIPQCTFGSWNPASISGNKNSVIELTCVDGESGILNSELLLSDLSVSDTDAISINNISSMDVVGGKKFTITVTSKNKQTTSTISLLAGKINDYSNNSNTTVVSEELNITIDQEPPIITVGDFCALKGSAFNMLNYVNVTDESDFTVTANPENLLVDEMGNMKVIYTATDSFGNVATKEINITIYTKLTDLGIVTTGDGLYADSLETGRYIYKGVDPNNHVIFNGSSDWRVLSIETDGTYKLIYTGTDYTSQFNSTTSGGLTFTSTTMNTYLNTELYSAFDVDAKQSIINHSFKNGTVPLSTTSTETISKLDEYEKTKSISLNVGLPTLTDIFRSSTAANCKDTATFNNVTGANDGYCKTNNWLNPDGYAGKDFWTMIPYGNDKLWFMDDRSFTYADSLTNSKYVLPVVYLDSDVVFVNGNGSKTSPYVVNNSCSSNMLFNEMKTCTIEHSSLNKNFKVNVDGGSGSYEYSWNDNDYISVNSFSRSEASLQNNQLSIKAIVKDKKSNQTITCNSTCVFGEWKSEEQYFSNSNETYSMTSAEKNNDDVYMNCSSGVLPTVCIQNNLNSTCYSCTLYSRSITCS